jgi:outer membrane protein assembly factor BamB
MTMNSRPTRALIIAIVLILFVMGIAVVLTLNSPREAKFTTQAAWSRPYGVAQSMNIIDLTGDGKGDLFLQNESNVSVWDANGNPIFAQDIFPPLATTMGDVDGDGVEDIVIFAPIETGPAARVVSRGTIVWTRSIRDMRRPARAAAIRFEPDPLIVLGDDNGLLVALSADGNEVWRARVSSGDAIRGLDDARVSGELLLAAANHNGNVALLDADGDTRWTYLLSGALRRLRAYDLNGDGTSEILIGGDGNRLVLLDAASGREIANRPLGQAITEIREAEINGEPSSREFVVGGKDGGVWAFRADGTQMWSASVSDKVNEIAGVDVDDDGAEEIIIGDEAGGVTLFRRATGDRHGLMMQSSAIARIDAGKLTGSDQIAVADGNTVQLLSLQKSDAPFFYTPLVAGIVVSIIIFAAAWFIGTLPDKSALRVAIEDHSSAGLLSRRRMLHEGIADVERLKQSGEMPPEAYLARLKELRGQLADTEAALAKAGASIKTETFKCPNCGGTLPLGVDKCEYCGQVVIS